MKKMFYFAGVVCLLFLILSGCGEKKSIQGLWYRAEHMGEQVSIEDKIIRYPYWPDTTWKPSEEEGTILVTQDHATASMQAELDDSGDILTFDGEVLYRDGSDIQKEKLAEWNEQKKNK